MATIRRFEDLEIWQQARLLCKVVFEMVNHESFSRDFKLINQMNGSSGSVMDNIAEGFDRGSRKEFILFLGIASGSCGEVKSQLYRAADRRYISNDEFNSAFNLADELSRKINGLIIYLNSSEITGQRFKNRVGEPESEYGNLHFNF